MVRLPRFFSPSRTTPATSAILAGSRGVRASKISVTRGRPPVMSCVPATSRGVLASSDAGRNLLAVAHFQVGLFRHVVTSSAAGPVRPR